MNNKQNLHTHTTYCDGANTLQQMVEYAILHGFDSIGFSEHSYTHFEPERSMSLEDTSKYIAEINVLKKIYKNRIKIYCGLEVEMYSNIDLSGYDYLIGASHYLLIDGEYVGFARKRDEVERVINTYFGGDGMKFALSYWRGICELASHGKFDIIGHFDIITKHSDSVLFFDTEDARYKNAALEAMDALQGKIPFFEVNTGAIARGYRKAPYPSPFLIREFKKRGFGAVITSDCHNGEKLDAGYELARELLCECGFDTRYILTESGFEEVAI